MTESITVHSISELEKYKELINTNLEICINQLKELFKKNNALEIFQELKFEPCVTEPLSGKPENLIEVINQSMTYLVSIMAAEYLYNTYPEQVFKINWGNAAGNDIESLDGTIIAECFAATSYRSNGKLTADLKRLDMNKSALHKYEFFYDKEFSDKQKVYYENKYLGIEIIKFKNIK